MSLFYWLRGLDLNQRPSGYEPDELPSAPPRDMHFSFSVFIIALIDTFVKG